jgi:hypothetical protein
MPKNDPLQSYLRNCGQRPVTLTFADVQRIIQASLPNSAYDWDPWWANDRTHVQARAWMNAGYQKDAVYVAPGRNPNNCWVRFI